MLPNNASQHLFNLYSQVTDHKTLTSHGETYIVVQKMEQRWLALYVQNFRLPNSTYLFQNSQGGQCSKVSREIKLQIKEVTGLQNNVTTTNIRHTTVSKASEGNLKIETA